MAYALLAHAGGSSGPIGPIDTTGATLIVLFTASDASPSVSDNQSNTWTGLTAASAPSTDKARLWYCYSPTTNASHTFSCAPSYATVAVQAFSGAVASPFDQENGASGTSVTALSTGSVTPTEGSELIVAGLCPGGTNSNHAIDSGFTITDSRNGLSGSWFGNAMAYLIQTSAGAVNPQWTWTTSNSAAAVIATFKDTPSVSAVGPLTGGGSLMHGRLIRGGRLVRAAPTLWLPKRIAA